MSLPDLVKYWHWTDTRTGVGQRSRTIGNWRNWRQHDLARQPVGDWQDNASADMDEGAAPDYWTGAWDFRIRRLKAPLQVFAGDSTDPINTALIGARRADNPNAWINIKALGVRTITPLVDVANQRIAWPLLWAQTDLMYDLGPAKMQQLIRLRSAAASPRQRFAVRIPDGYTLDIVEGEGGYLLLRDEQGSEVFHTPPAHGWDSSTVALDGAQRIRVSVTRGDPITVGTRELATYWVEGNAEDLAAATYPVTLDPTATISGTSAIEDMDIRSSAPDANYGAITFATLGNLGVAPQNTQKLFWRILSPATNIPAGTINSFTMRIFRAGSPNSSQAGTAVFHAITDANTWVEGTATGIAQAGSSCWNKLIYNTTSWAGTAGASTDGTDYRSDVSPPSWAFPALASGTVQVDVSLTPAWASNWRDSVWVNNGFFGFKSGAYLSGALAYFYSTENASNPMSFIIDYTEGPTTRPYYYGQLLRRVRY